MAEEPAPAPLTRIADVLALPKNRAALALPVRVRGVVTYRAGGIDFILQDDTGGIYVNANAAFTAHRVSDDDLTLFRTVTEGFEIELEGHTNQGGYAPNIFPHTLRLLGTKPLPAPVPVITRSDWTRFLKGAECSRRVEVRAVVQGFQSYYDEKWTLFLNANPGFFIAQIDRAVCADPALLVDAEILLRGSASSHFNTRGEFTMTYLRTNEPGDLVIEKPAPPIEKVPWVSLEDLQPFHPAPPVSHRVRVHGTVVFSLPESFLYLQDGLNAVRVETNSALVLNPGDRIEAIGFVDMTREIGMLRDATILKIGSGVPPAAIDITPEEIIAINQLANSKGQMARPHDFDGHLVRFRARLLAVQAGVSPRQPQHRLLLERPGNNGTVLQANLLSGPAGNLDALRPGSEIEVTGLVQLAYGPHKESSFRRWPTQMDLILRGAQDVSVIQAPSWWTARRLAGLLGVVALLLAAVIFWSLQLKRQVHRKTRLLAKEMSARRDAAVEFQATLRERNLLAANLHDTLLQTMGGLGFQLEACEAEAETPAPHGKPPVHLAFARRMLDHAVDELRNSVWTLRSMPLDGMSIPEALTMIASRLGTGRETQIEIKTDPDFPRVPDFIAGNLLLVAQEALHNALKHAAPRTVTLELRSLPHPDRISLTVRDDGSGFNPGTQQTAADGHFGLLGMRERMDRLSGSFHIQSAPGQGTTVHAEIPLRSYDEDLTDRPIDEPPPAG
ncbi:MAG: sensor histidine kinase [Luteolibacter sp.]|nr:sensor histidine kinase [Luteolibacter sp.]